MTRCDAHVTTGDVVGWTGASTIPVRMAFLLLPGFPLLGYASAVEPLRAANRLSGRCLYEWRHAACDAGPVPSSNGIAVAPDIVVGASPDFHVLVVCAGGDPASFRHPPTLAWLRALDRAGIRLGGLSGGAYPLARAGLLRGRRVTLHWEHAAAFVEDFPDLDLRRSLFEIDRDRLTCGGGTAALDMMHAVIAGDHGPDLARAVSEWLLQTQVRAGAAPQRMDLRDRLGITHEGLLRALVHMEAHLAESLSRRDLAALAGVSPRQLERLFRFHLGRSPGAHHLGLRLDNARRLVRQTGMSVIQVAVACGFTSASHFSRAYRARHGRSPAGDRRAS